MKYLKILLVPLTASFIMASCALSQPVRQCDIDAKSAKCSCEKCSKKECDCKCCSHK